ncbi:MAG: hypothetical protein WCY30_00110 [Candidatus Neomarinimicrobiota bacterium]
MGSLRNEIAKRIINPAQLIKEAEEKADIIVSTLAENEKAVGEFNLNPEDNILKQASDLMAAIDSYKEEHVADPVPGPATEPDDKTASKQKIEKSAAAKILEMAIVDDIIADLFTEKSAALNPDLLNDVDLDSINNEVSEKLAKLSWNKIKKPLGITSAIIGAGGAGYGVGQILGRKKLQKYIDLDAVRDRINNQRIYQYAYLHGKGVPIKSQGAS